MVGRPHSLQTPGVTGKTQTVRSRTAAKIPAFVRLLAVVGLFAALGILGAGILATGILGSGILGGSPVAAADPLAVRTEDVPSLPAVLFEAKGPNDGDLIEGRYLALDIFSNYGQNGALRFHANDQRIGDRPYFGAGGNIVETRVLLDLDDVGGLQNPEEWLDGLDSVRITVSLFDTTEAEERLVTSTTWSGDVDVPHIEYVVPLIDRNPLDDGDPVPERERQPEAPADDDAMEAEFGTPNGDHGLAAEAANTLAADPKSIPPGAIAVIAHGRPRDSFYVVAASLDRDALRQTPSSTRFQRHAVVLDAGPFAPSVEDSPSTRAVGFGRWWIDMELHTRYLVVWTYGVDTGWSRSVIHQRGRSR